MGHFDHIETKQNYGTHEIRRIDKNGVASDVTTTDADYPTPPAGEKLVFFQGSGQPFTFKSRTPNDKGEFDDVEMIELEFQILTGRGKGDRFLIPFSTKVSDRSNLGKFSLATNGRIVGKVSDLLNGALRKPFFIFTENEQKETYTKVKFVSARPYDELVDGPIGGQAQPAPQPVAVPAADEGAALFDVDL